MTFGWLTYVGSCGLCGVALFDLVEECVEVAAGELPFERFCDLLVAAAEGEERVLEGAEIGEVVGLEHLVLDDSRGRSRTG